MVIWRFHACSEAYEQGADGRPEIDPGTDGASSGRPAGLRRPGRWSRADPAGYRKRGASKGNPAPAGASARDRRRDEADHPSSRGAGAVKGLDTNVLVRYLTQDDLRQAAVAVREIEGAARKREKLLLQPLVLCELVWVLESAYKVRKMEILAVLERILRTAQFEVAQKDIVWRSLADYRAGKGDFADYYLARSNESAGAAFTLTFDRALKGDPRFRVLAGQN